ENIASRGVDETGSRARMCGSPDGTALAAHRKRDAEIGPSQGVDGSESRARMCGSPGRNDLAVATSGTRKKMPHWVLTEAKVALDCAAPVDETTSRSPPPGRGRKCPTGC